MQDALSPLARSLQEAGFGGALLCEEPLARHTTWRLGGPAELLATPTGRDDLVLATRWAAAKGVPWRVLGNGSNLLVRDEGVRGLVLRLRKVLDQVEVRGATVTAGAGALLPAVANAAAGKGLAGLEFGAGIPGTIGGAVVMNGGWHQWEIGTVVEAVDWLAPDGVVARVAGDACAFRYRGSAFRDRPGIVLGTSLALRQDDPAAVEARLETFAASRKANQPTELPSCGSVFLKPEGDFAGRLIERAGLKGFVVGAVQVSPKHANFFVNLGGGKAADALALVEHVERVVLERFGVRLTREFELW